MKKTELKKGYYTKKLNNSFATMRGFYAMFMPVMVPYKKLKQKMERMSIEVDWKVGMIEQAPSFGRGWIGVSVDKKTDANLPHKEIKGDFVAFDHVGSYRELGKTWKKIMADYPEATEFYSLYMNDPETTPEKKLKTTIIFKLK